MKYFKLTDVNKKIIRIDKCETNVSNGIEITEKEYNSILNNFKSKTQNTNGIIKTETKIFEY